MSTDGGRHSPPEPDAKRRRISGLEWQTSPSSSGRNAIVSDFSDDEDEVSDWEEVDLRALPLEEAGGQPTLSPDPSQNVEFTTEPTKPVSRSKRSITSVDRKIRLEGHKCHLVCLMYNFSVINHLCNIGSYQLRKCVTEQTLSRLKGTPEGRATARSHRNQIFMMGLTTLGSQWKQRFRIDSYGSARPTWLARDEYMTPAANTLEDAHQSLRSVFEVSLKEMRGNRDYSAALFVCMLRSVGIEARLVCSLQPLPFDFGKPSGSSEPGNRSPRLADRPRAVSSADTTRGVTRPLGGSDVNAVAHRKRPAFSGGGAMPRLSQPPNRNPLQSSVVISEAPYPVVWTEVWNHVDEKWTCFDPVVTGKIDSPQAFDPPPTEPDVGLQYVIAFESDGYAKDVTLRYAKEFDSKTRKRRVESTKNGESWYKSLLKPFRRRYKDERESSERQELALRRTNQKMPSNLQDFKQHPIFVLERHLKSNQCIYPKNAVGQFRVGKASNVEQVYPRSNVITVRTADQWYRLGRVVKDNEIPLKVLKSTARDDPQISSKGNTLMYGLMQTELYRPPDIVSGKVPKNAFGTIDVFAPNMVPANATHFQDPRSRKAAQLLEIDYAEAVVDFRFRRGNRPEAVKAGVVVASEYSEAIALVVECMHQEEVQRAFDIRQSRAAELWRRLYRAASIRARLLREHAVEGVSDNPVSDRNDSGVQEESEEEQFEYESD